MFRTKERLRTQRLLLLSLSLLVFVLVLLLLLVLLTKLEVKMYGLLTKCKVKMSGYWISSFLRAYGPRRSQGRWTSKKKNKRGQYPAMLTEQAWSIKDSLYGFWGNFSCGTQQGSSERARKLQPARSGSQSQRRIWFVLPVRGASLIMNKLGYWSILGLGP